jgi:hypothetical protein
MCCPDVKQPDQKANSTEDQGVNIKKFHIGSYVVPYTYIPSHTGDRGSWILVQGQP